MRVNTTGIGHNVTLCACCLSCCIKMPRLGTNKVWILSTWSLSKVVGISVNSPPHTKCLFNRVFHNSVFSPNDPPPHPAFGRCSYLWEEFTLFSYLWLEFENKLTLLLLRVLYFLKIFYLDLAPVYLSKNILLIIGIVISVFLRPEKHLQIFECPVKLYVLSSDQ